MATAQSAARQGRRARHAQGLEGAEGHQRQARTTRRSSRSSRPIPRSSTCRRTTRQSCTARGLIPAYPPYYYYPPGYVAGGALLGFTAGVIVGGALWGNCNWGARRRQHQRQSLQQLQPHQHLEWQLEAQRQPPRGGAVSRQGRRADSTGADSPPMLLRARRFVAAPRPGVSRSSAARYRRATSRAAISVAATRAEQVAGQPIVTVGGRDTRGMRTPTAFDTGRGAQTRDFGSRGSSSIGSARSSGNLSGGSRGGGGAREAEADVAVAALICAARFVHDRCNGGRMTFWNRRMAGHQFARLLLVVLFGVLVVTEARAAAPAAEVVRDARRRRERAGAGGQDTRPQRDTFSAW